MSDLDDSVSLFQRIFDSVKRTCPVCGKEMSEDDDDLVLAFRIRETFQNVKMYGQFTIFHPFNRLYVCTTICAERVTRSWENDKSGPKKLELVKSIREDNQRFIDSFTKVQHLLYSPNKKKTRK